MQSSDHNYLEKLKFNPKLRETWLNFFVTNFRVVMLLIILISIWGVYAYIKLPVESNPEVKIPIAVVIVPYPGASPSVVEELVTKKIETGIAGISGIKKITSTSANSISSVVVEFEASQNLDDSIRKVRDEVTTIQKDLPSDTQDAQVNEISFDDRPILTIALSGPFDGFTLRNYADKIKDELEKNPGIREVNITGGDEHEFSVAYDPHKLATYGISAAQANQIIAATNQAIPAGNFEGKEYSYAVRTDARFYQAKDIAKIPVTHTESGAVVLLGDIADVQEASIKKTNYSRLSRSGEAPQNSVTLSIIKKSGGSIIDIADFSKQKTDELLKTFPAGISYDVPTDFAKQIRHDFNQLTHDFLLTLGLVFTILFLIVGLKEALVAGLAIPLVFFISFGVMLMTGISLNFLSLFSLILALGLLVDDAIVVVSATKQYLKTGKFTPEEAVLLVLNDFKVVLTTTTLATVWAFLPLLMATGIIGQFIKSIPITVSVTLTASLLVALMINHPLAAILERIRLTKKMFLINIMLLFGLVAGGIALKNTLGYVIAGIATVSIFALLRWFEKGGKQKLILNKELSEREWQDDELIKTKLRVQGDRKNASFSEKLIHGIIHFDLLIPIYEKFLRMVLATKKTRLMTLLFVAVVFAAALAMPISGIVKSEFFPPSDQETIYVNMEAPIGLNLDETNKLIAQVEQKLLAYPEVTNFATNVGSSMTEDGSGGSGSHLASITVSLVPKEQRSLVSYNLAEKMRADFKSTPNSTVTVSSPSGGPPSGSAFQAQISGDDLQVLDKIANDLKPKLDSINGVVDSSISLKNAPAEYTFALDPQKMELYNLNASSVGGALRMAISGLEVTTVIRDNKELKVMASFDENKLPDLESVQNLQLLNSIGKPVYIKDVAKVELTPAVDSITRIDQKRTVLLKSGVSGSNNSNAVVSAFQQKVKDEYTLPSGYAITYGGENEQNTESVLSIIRAMALAAMLIISTLIIQFNSFKKAMIVLVTLPLALIGVFFGMALFGITLSFPGLIGILALFGIVVKNAIILIDKINLNIKSDIPFEEAVVDAGKSRLEAIFITSICTIAGIVPITLSNELWRALGSAVIFGLLISSFLTLFIIPVMYQTFIRKDERF